MLRPFVRQLLSDGNWHPFPEIVAAVVSDGTLVRPEQAVRRYLAAFDTKEQATAELHYQISYGTKLLVYDALRAQSKFIERDPPVPPRTDGKVGGKGGRGIDMSVVRWRLIGIPDMSYKHKLPENSIRNAMRKVLSDEAWHTLDDLGEAIRLVATEQQAIKAYDRAVRAARTKSHNSEVMPSLLHAPPIEEGYRILARESVAELDKYGTANAKSIGRINIERRTQYRLKMTEEMTEE